MVKAILIPVLVLACALPARADVSSSAAAGVVGSVQDFEGFDTGKTNPHLLPESKGYFWSSPADATLVSTTVKNDSGRGTRYLYINASERPDEGLLRTFTTQGAASGVVTNAYTQVSGDEVYCGFYCQFVTKFPLFDRGLSPELDDIDRLMIWARKNPNGDTLPGELYVTAGRFVGDLRTVERHDYLIASTNIDESVWHQVTVRVIPEIVTGSRSLGFELWIDGNRVFAGSDYPVIDSVTDTQLLSTESLALISAHRLFPALTRPGSNRSVALGGVAFTGIGDIDDVSVSTVSPGSWAAAPRTFTLAWDAGVKSISYQLAGGSAVAVPSAQIKKRSTVFEVPVAETAISVSVGYDSARGYSQGFWGAAGAASVVTNISGSVTNYSFKVDASDAAGTGYVRSFRREIGLGGGIGAFATFADAKEQAIAQGVTMVLNEDFAPAIDSRDEGQIIINPGERLVLDLNGHTIGNAVGEVPTILNYGRLTIIDSDAKGGGRVVPFQVYDGTGGFRQTAIQNYASSVSTPELEIQGGTYDGLIDNRGEVTNKVSKARREGVLRISRNGYSPSYPKFISYDSEVFEWNDKLVDPTLFYGYEAPYWMPVTNAFVWCGAGADTQWTTAANWRGGTVPGADDLVIFPVADEAWEVDLGDGVAARNLRFDGDVVLHGSNDCSAVRWAASTGRVSGDAVLVWQGRLPGDLSTLLAADWKGTVALVEVGDGSPMLMSDLASWGTAASKVVFHGVRGYYHLTGNLSLPFELVLEDGSHAYAWKNDAGFTGGVIEFAKVSGSGAFLSSKNTIPNRQLILFRDVSGYSGAINAQGKRVVLGPGEAVTLEVGSITWSDGVDFKLYPTVTNRCQVAAFGGRMTVTGAIGDLLAEYSDTTVGDESEVVTLRDGTVCELCVTNPVGEVRLAAWSEEAVVVDGLRVVTNELQSLNSQSSIKAASTRVPQLKFAKYYTPSVTTNGQLVTVKLALNQNAVPVIGGSGDERAQIVFADGLASIVVSGAIDGFWYGLEYKGSLADEWPAEPYIWTVAVPGGDGKVELVAPAEGASGFYRVVVSDVMPQSAGGGR